MRLRPWPLVADCSASHIGAKRRQRRCWGNTEMSDDFVEIPPGRGRGLTCVLCGLYACTHMGLTILMPADTDRDASSLIVATGTASVSDTGLAIVLNMITEDEV